MYTTTQLQDKLRELRQAGANITAQGVRDAFAASNEAHAALLAVEQEIALAQRDGMRRDYLHELFKRRLDLAQIDHDLTCAAAEAQRLGGHLLALEAGQQRKVEQEKQRLAYVATMPAPREEKEPDAVMMRKLRGQARYGGFRI